MSTRGRILSFGSAALLVVVGAVCAALFSGTLGQVLAMVLIGLGLVGAVGLVFLEVGLSEDRERAREAHQEPAAEPPSRPSHGVHSQESQERSRLGRMRGSRRRLR